MPLSNEELRDLILRAKPINNLFDKIKFPFNLLSSTSYDDGSPGSFLDHIFYTDSNTHYGEKSIGISIDMLLPANLEISLFGLDYITFGIGQEGFVTFTLHAVWSKDNLEVMFENIELAVRFSRDLLMPVKVDQNNIPVKTDNNFEEPEGNTRASIFTTGSLILDKEFDIATRGFDSLSLTPCKLKNLPVAFTFHNLKLDLSKKESIPEILDAGFDEAFQGIYVESLGVYFAGEIGTIMPDITANDFVLGTGGISGSFAADFELVFDPVTRTFAGDACGSLFGIEAGLDKIDLALRANNLESFGIDGQLFIPYFETEAQEPVPIGIHISRSGDTFSIGASNIPEISIFNFKLALTAFSLAFTDSRITGSEIKGTLTIPDWEGENGQPAKVDVGFEIRGGGKYLISASLTDAPFNFGSLIVRLDELQIGFDSNGIIEGDTTIGGTIEIPAFKDQNGDPLKLSFKLDLLPDGFRITVEIAGDPGIKVLDIENVVEIYLKELALGKTGADWEFAIAGRIKNEIAVPAAEDMLPSELIIHELSYLHNDFNFGLELVWPGGLSIQGDSRSGASIYIPVAREIGSVFYLDAVQIDIEKVDGRNEIGFALEGARLTLGPFTAVVDGIGLTIAIDRRDGGNLGPVDVGLEFRPPNGFGLSIDTAGLRGGGYLFFDTENERYAGAIELSFQNTFQLAAIGLITTRLPDGSKGISVLIIICVQFTPGIALGYGFFISGVGGMVGIHRTLQTDAMREGVKNNTIDYILFPENILQNISSIIRNLREIFPPKRDQFILGVMAKITWSVPPILQIELGLVIEFTNPVKIAILGVLKVVLPTEETALIRLQVNFLGLIDFERGEISFDASLYNSKILILTLEGDMAVRLSWGAQKAFLLSVGGFHPAYNPPAHLKLSSMKRLTISLLSGNPSITLTAYMAVTSNTVQFGASIDLLFKVSKFKVVGYFGFDVLFQFSPFKLITNIRAGVAVKLGGTTLLSITAEFVLQGPTPWIANGTGKFKILFFTVKVKFKKTWGEKKEIMEPAIAALPRVIQALTEDKNWQSELPAKRFLLTTRRASETTGDEIVVHPSGTLVISQNILPLDINISRLGSSRVSDIKRITIKKVTSDSHEMETQHTKGSFAPISYKTLSDDEKLKSPSYVDETNGVRSREDSARIEYGINRQVVYEVRLSDTDMSAGGGLDVQKLEDISDDREKFIKMTRGGAVGRSTLSREKRISRLPEKTRKVDLSDESFTIVNTDDLHRSGLAEIGRGTKSRIDDELSRILKDNPELKGTIQIVPEFELVK